MSYREISRITVSSARKAHRCTWCDEAIKKGDRYVRIRSVFDGEPHTSKFHCECEEAIKRTANEEAGDFEYYPGEGERGKSFLEMDR